MSEKVSTRRRPAMRGCPTSTGHKTSKVLFLSLSGIGNFLMQSPTWQAVKKARPDWKITLWVAPRGTAELAQADPSVDSVLLAPPQNSPGGHLKTVRELRRRNFGIGVVLSPGQLLKSAAYLRLAGIPQRVGHKYPFFNNPRNSLFLTKSTKEDKSLHDIEQNLRLLPLLDICHRPRGDTGYQINYLPPPALDHAAAKNKKWAGFHPGSAPHFLWKRWPLENFAAVGRELIARGYHILIFGGSEENNLKEELRQKLGAESTTVAAGLLQAAGLMRKCRFVLSNDSGLMHLAAASGTTVFGVFGPTDEARTGPRGPKTHVIRAPGTKPVYHINNRHNLGVSPHPSIAAVGVSQVVDKIARAGPL